MNPVRNLRSAASRRNSASFRETTMIQVENDTENYAKKLEGERRRLTNINMVTIFVTEPSTHIKTHLRLTEICKNKQKQSRIASSPLTSHWTLLRISCNTPSRQTPARRQITTQYLKKSDKLIGTIAAMKAEINQLRREKNTLFRNIGTTYNQIEELEVATANQYTEIENKTKIAEEAKIDVVALRQKLDKEEKTFRRRFKGLKEQYELEVQQNLKNDTHYQTHVEYDHFDTATLLKRRLQAIILNNKEKIKMIDTYQRNMRILDDAFNTIKQTSGLTNINEIEAIFVKSEQQNCALLTYLDMLNQEIDALEDANSELEEKCRDQEKENKERQNILNSTPEEEKKRALLKKIAQQKLVLVNEVEDMMSKVSPNVLTSLQHLNRSAKDNVFTRFNYERILGEIDRNINQLLLAKSKKVHQNLIDDALQISHLNQKVESSRLGGPNNIDAQMESSQFLYDYSRLQEIAKDALKKMDSNKRTTDLKKKQS